MKCVWREAVAGSERIPGGARGAPRGAGRGRSAPAGHTPPGCASCASASETCRRDLRGRTGPRAIRCRSCPGHTSPGRFERVLRAGQFAVTSELAPPDSADPEDVYRRARIFDGYVDAINATDGSGANCHMSSLAVCALLTRVGYAPVMQISCRDRNRIAIQGDILGGAAMGVCNLLVPHRRWRAGRRSSAGAAGVRSGLDVAFGNGADAARRASFSLRPQDQLRTARAARGGRESLRAAARMARHAAGEEGRRRRAVHPDPVLLRRAAAEELHGPGRGPGPARQGVHPGRRRARCARPRRPSGSARTCPACTFPTR